MSLHATSTNVVGSFNENLLCLLYYAQENKYNKTIYKKFFRIFFVQKPQLKNPISTEIKRLKLMQ